jgi:hypothetical protein
LPMITGIANAVPRTRRELVAENALLRQQAIVASRKVKRPCWQSSLAMAPGPVATSTHRIAPRNDQLPGRCRLWRRCRGSMSSRFRATPGLGRAPATGACGSPAPRIQSCGALRRPRPREQVRRGRRGDITLRDEASYMIGLVTLVHSSATARRSSPPPLPKSHRPWPCYLWAWGGFRPTCIRCAHSRCHGGPPSSISGP